ncbi:MAG: TAT-variant-translocated molybdopterin oxidoreductase [Bacteroidota bacterium]
MKEQNKSQVWIGSADLTNDPEYKKAGSAEFVELPIVDAIADEKQASEFTSSRRDFLKYAGFGLGAATLAASCDVPIKKAIPYVTKPDAIVPGVANYYASTFIQGGDYCAVLVKTREGRPIFIEGNRLSPISGGGTSARVQASVLSLYDSNRYKTAMKKGAVISWGDMDKEIMGALNTNSNIRILTNTILSPTAKHAIGEFTNKFPKTKVVTYDPISSSAMLQANEADFGDRVIPNYHFEKADVIVSFGADFVGTWISPVEYSNGYINNRKIDNYKKPKMSRHIQVEAGMSLTGSNADDRVLIRPSEQGSAIAFLYNAVAAKTGGTKLSGLLSLNDRAKVALSKVAGELLANQGQSLVVSDSNNVGEQTLVNAINHLLKNYGKTVEFEGASLQRQGIDAEVQGLIKEMEDGKVDALFILAEANPAFDLPNADRFAAALENVKMSVACSTFKTETAEKCTYIAPCNYYLESWGDAEPKRGYFSLMQPTIAPLFDTRQWEQSFLTWGAVASYNSEAEQPYYDYLRSYWKKNIFSRQNAYGTFVAFWDNTLHDGVLNLAQGEPKAYAFNGNVQRAARKINQPSTADIEISFFETVNIGAGQFADNPWLQEMPDPISRCAWGNVLYVPIKWDGKNDFDGFAGIGSKTKKGIGDKVNLTVNGTTENVTATTNFGQPYIGEAATFSMALGYGRTQSGECGLNVGENAFPMIGFDDNGNTKYYADVENIEWADYDDNFACVQYHHTYGVFDQDDPDYNLDDHAIGINGYDGAITNRSVIFHTTLDKIPEKQKEMEKFHEKAEHLNSKTLYPYEEYMEDVYGQGHHWGLHIDMGTCIGCGACTVACMAENNIPVVGKKEVHRHHEMNWLRIDRYFLGDVENPNVVYQPMMCQHCDNAPCENVCPVAATNHSSEGLNQMTYNRCIGTRYCANNCPYKVRRFNWLDYTTADLFPVNQYDVNGEEIPFGADNLTRMVLNPDVTVRSRGVIEKCSMCVQRIQQGKLLAKTEGRRLQDGDLIMACESACPTDGITFGDLNDPNSRLNKKLNTPMNFKVLEEINTRSSVDYSVKVFNKREPLS